MDFPQISVIVAVYNAEGYLNRFYDSIKSQTFGDFELICVNDGSVDRSTSIIAGLAAQDNRIRLINQENKGVSAARQTGFDHANGIYVIHADPDDWVEPDWLECLYNEAERTGADMTICDFERVYRNKTVKYCQKPTSLQPEDVLKDLLGGRLWGPCWNKLIRRECFQKYDIAFIPDMNLWEDLYVNSLLLSYGIKVAYIPKTLYHYDSFTNSNSIVQHRKPSHVRSGMILIDSLQAKLSDRDFDDCWYHLKSRVKAWIFDINSENQDIKFDIREVYQEINKRFIKESKRKPLWTKERCITLCLQGHPKVGYTLYRAEQWCKSMIRK